MAPHAEAAPRAEHPSLADRFRQAFGAPRAAPAVKLPVVKAPASVKPAEPAKVTAEHDPAQGKMAYATLPDGTRVAPDSFDGGYYGTADVPPKAALGAGFPARGTNVGLQNHSEEKGNTAFRGTTAMPADPLGNGGAAAEWAGDGGYVYQIVGVPTWDVNAHLEGRVPTATGFRGNLMHGENERAIPARVPPERIKRWGRVEATPSGKLVIKKWIDNPDFRPAS